MYVHRATSWANAATTSAMLIRENSSATPICMIRSARRQTTCPPQPPRHRPPSWPPQPPQRRRLRPATLLGLKAHGAVEAVLLVPRQQKEPAVAEHREAAVADVRPSKGPPRERGDGRCGCRGVPDASVFWYARSSSVCDRRPCPAARSQSSSWALRMSPCANTEASTPRSR
jgi:hypothetical protein